MGLNFEIPEDCYLKNKNIVRKLELLINRESKKWNDMYWNLRIRKTNTFALKKLLKWLPQNIKNITNDQLDLIKSIYKKDWTKKLTAIELILQRHDFERKRILRFLKKRKRFWVQILENSYKSLKYWVWISNPIIKKNKELHKKYIKLILEKRPGYYKKTKLTTGKLQLKNLEKNLKNILISKEVYDQKSGSALNLPTDTNLKNKIELKLENVNIADKVLNDYFMLKNIKTNLLKYWHSHGLDVYELESDTEMATSDPEKQASLGNLLADPELLNSSDDAEMDGEDEGLDEDAENEIFLEDTDKDEEDFKYENDNFEEQLDYDNEENSNPNEEIEDSERMGKFVSVLDTQTLIQPLISTLNNNENFDPITNFWAIDAKFTNKKVGQLEYKIFNDTLERFLDTDYNLWEDYTNSFSIYENFIDLDYLDQHLSVIEHDPDYLFKPKVETVVGFIKDKLKNEYEYEENLKSVLLEELLKNEKIVYRKVFQDFYFKSFIAKLAYKESNDFMKKDWVAYLTNLAEIKNNLSSNDTYRYTQNNDWSLRLETLKESWLTNENITNLTYFTFLGESKQKINKYIPEFLDIIYQQNTKYLLNYSMKYPLNLEISQIAKNFEKRIIKHLCDIKTDTKNLENSEYFNYKNIYNLKNQTIGREKKINYLTLDDSNYSIINKSILRDLEKTTDKLKIIEALSDWVSDDNNNFILDLVLRDVDSDWELDSSVDFDNPYSNNILENNFDSFNLYNSVKKKINQLKN